MSDDQKKTSGKQGLYIAVGVIAVAVALIVWATSGGEKHAPVASYETAPELLSDPTVDEGEQAESARAGFDLLRSAIMRHHRATLESALTRDSKELFAKDFRFGRALKDVRFRSETVKGDIIFIEVVEVTRAGEERETVYAFSKEAGNWKLDLAMTEAKQAADKEG